MLKPSNTMFQSLTLHQDGLHLLIMLVRTERLVQKTNGLDAWICYLQEVGSQHVPLTVPLHLRNKCASLEPSQGTQSLDSPHSCEWASASRLGWLPVPSPSFVQLVLGRHNNSMATTSYNPIIRGTLPVISGNATIAIAAPQPNLWLLLHVIAIATVH
jgi:hypothetical protein